MFKDKISCVYKMDEETGTLPKPPSGYEYALRKKSSISLKDPTDLTSRQLACRKYYEKNRQKINEESLKRYHEKKK